MPKSKRNRLVSLTVTKKKGIDLKTKLIDLVKESADNYEKIFLFSVHNMRNCKLKDVRNDWKDSKFIFGKNKVVAAAFGHRRDDEYKENLHKLSQFLIGQKGLLFTNSSTDDVISYFNKLSSPDYARTDDIASETVILPEGPLEQFDSSMEPFLRSLGLSTSLKKGVITLTQEFTVCKIGEKLTADKAKLLKLLGIQMAEFKICLEIMWSNDGHVEIFDKGMKKKIKRKITRKVTPSQRITRSSVNKKVVDDDEVMNDDNDVDDE